MNLAFCSQNEKDRFCLPKSCDYKTMAENNKSFGTYRRLRTTSTVAGVFQMRDLETKPTTNPLRGSLNVRVGMIRDGTQGISLSMGDNLIGEWTDSRARTLTLTRDYKVAICAENGEKLYHFSVPGKTLSGEQLSDAEVLISFEMTD
jgi:hypothetical protein